MDFFEQEEKAHRQTKVLVLYFVTGVAVLIAVIYLAVAVLFNAAGLAHQSRRYGYFDRSTQPRATHLWNPELFLGVAAGTLAVIGIGSAFKIMELGEGGSAVANLLGGRLVNPNTADPDERKLLDVVEEMAIASGVPVPHVYVMDAEQGINAFAAGHSTSDAVVCVTRGCLKLLNRDELQGVVGHEFSHILNGDMRLNLRLMGLIFGIICLAIIGRVLLYAPRGSRDRNNALPLIGLVLFAVGWIGVFFGRLIQAAVSRQREFLADASSVQFTRNPDGISGALKKIGAYSFGSHLESPHAEQASHMYFSNGVSEPFFGAMATHPPIADRIRAVEPTWDGKFPPLAKEQIEVVRQAAIAELEGARSRRVFPFPVTPRAGAGLGGLAPPIIAAQAVVPNVGAVSTAHLRFAVALRDSFPPSVQTAARDALGASAVIYALLISTEPAQRERQFQILAQKTSDAIVRETQRLLADVQSVAAHAKLPLIDLALPALRHFSPAQYQQFSQALQALIASDAAVDLHEFVLQKIVLRHLDPQFNGARKPVIQYYSAKPLAPDFAVLLSALARAGSDVPAQAQAAFQQGAQSLAAYAQAPLGFVPAEQCKLPQVDQALDRLSQAAPQIKKNLLNACVQTVAADGVVQESEAELLRAIADALDCPMPPFLQPQSPTPPAA